MNPVRESPCQAPVPFAIVRLPVLGGPLKTLTKSSSWQSVGFAGNGDAVMKEVDEQRKLPHNLISLLLTNKTICR
jgi:hypothetical protein